METDEGVASATSDKGRARLKRLDLQLKLKEGILMISFFSVVLSFLFERILSSPLFLYLYLKNKEIILCGQNITIVF